MNKKPIRTIIRALDCTIFLPLNAIMAFGYWVQADDEVTYWEAFKAVIN